MDLPEDLVAHLCRVSRLSADEAEKLLAEVLSFYGEGVEAFVTRRHAELQRQGLNNHAIFAQLQQELAQRRFAAPPLSARQLRRMVYG